MTTNLLFKRHRLSLAAASALGLASLGAHAQIVVNDTLTGNASTYSWIPQGGACLTAGDSTSGTGAVTNKIPACVGLAYYSGKTLVGGVTGKLPDAAGQGALRLTNGDTTTNGSNGNNANGAVVSRDGFSTTNGVQITWTSRTYGGNGYDAGYGPNGADGITFFLADALQPASVGGNGGSLGYSCSNGNGVYNGVLGGYVGVGTDEYGNFTNKSDNTATGPSFYPGRIGVRGAGMVNWTQLSTDPVYKYFYPGSENAAWVKAACSKGIAHNYDTVAHNDAAGNSVGAGKDGGATAKLADYAYLTSSNLPIDPSTITPLNSTGTPYKIANQEGQKLSYRGQAAKVTYQLSITPAGILNLFFTVNDGSQIHSITDFDIVSANGLAFPANVRFGFSAGTGGGSNVHEITCFKASPSQQSNASAGSNVQQGARVNGGSQIYLAFYYPDNWYSSLKAYGLSATDATIGSANWDANCALTGGACAEPVAANLPVPSPASRVILTSYNGVGKKFEYSGGLDNNQISALNDGNSSFTTERINWLRGDRTQEAGGAAGGTLRLRKALLGDIVDSSPTWVGPPNSPYTTKFVDKLAVSTAQPEGTSYTTFAGSGAGGYAGRMNTVYVGANDGMLHGFRSGTYSGTTFDSTYNDGAETIAYMPGQVVGMIHQKSNASLDLSSPAYSHNFYVDGTPGTGDLYYNGKWHTWIVGGLGPGGQATGPIGVQTITTSATAIFALDVTDPTQFSEANASSLVIGEWTPSSITCISNSNCGKNLGLTYGQPQIRRLHNGKWGVIFGNGLNSVNYTAGIFVMIVDPSGGAPTFRYLDTGSGSSSAPNGIAGVTPTDLDGDHITDYVYAGDQQGNVWRFDLTDANPSNWTGATKLYTTPAGQPITTRIAVASVPAATSPFLPKVIVAFGTGQKQPLTLSSAETYATASQTLYGIWDWNMGGWNGTATDTKYDSMTSLPSTTALQSQTITTTASTTTGVSGYRSVTSNAMCWANSSATCAVGTNNQIGWSVTLPGTQEQVIYNPVVVSGMFVVNTTIPANNSTLTCDSTTASGYTMALQMVNGGAASASFFQGPDGTFSTGNYSGIGLGGVGTPSVVTTTNSGNTSGTGNNTYIVQQTVKGTPDKRQVNPVGGTGSRVNWTKVR